MENEASETSARLSAIVESSEDAIISKNLNGIITSWNRSAEIIFGYKPAEAIGKHISLIIPDDLIEEESIIISKVKKGERIEHYETIRKRKDGSLFPIALTVSPIKDENGIVIGASKIARDINDLKEAEEKQARLAAIINSSDDAIVSKNLNGIITSWNIGAANIFGYAEEEAIGKHITLIIPEELIEEEKEIIRKIRQGEKVDHFETIRIKKDGTKINISLTVSPIKNKAGIVIGASKIARDITEKVEMEMHKKLFTQKLQQLNDYKDEFMAMASHELKTPLTVIKANLQLLEYKMQQDNNIEFITKTLRSVNKLSDLISGLLDVSKIQSGKLELNATTFDIRLLLKDVAENIQQAMPSHKTIFKEIKEELIVKADKDKIEQVIINMLTNAIKYSPNADELIVDAYKKDRQIIVSIQDYGIGIPLEDIKNIFARFYRVGGLASTFSGSGIGLYISSEIIKQHGGDMWAESEMGEGSTFYFSLSAADKNKFQQSFSNK